MEIGKSAPGFELYDQSDNLYRLSDSLGAWVVLFFYPKDNTPGCTAEVCDFNSEYDRLLVLGVKLFGISTDSRRSHQRFAQKHQLKFPILSDQQGKVASAYESLFRLGPVKIAKRDSFIINPQGEIAAIYRGVQAKGHGRFIHEKIQQLMAD
ncbi:peroxiredoxin [Candidatus Thiodiazotropha endoloripes]|uniref:peroxiredoxin n=1 Tax=Candidatus Thiodiazotropha endoloripes TaxID=1818881 RepID=UPI0009F3C9BC|nr:peroxiredoxin [Candidatus Thiodiazotropha endoloripes]MCG7914001.1 peroxiredoxin [Candidatus Thiodiazotropha weberae]